MQFLRRLPIVALARATVELRGDAVTVGLREALHAFVVREVLPNQAVHVLVGPALPGMVRCREAELQWHARLDSCVAVELGPIVRRDRGDGVSPISEEALESRIQVRCGATGTLVDHDVAGLCSTSVTMHARAWLSPKAVSTSQCPMRERLVASAGRVEHLSAPITPPDVATRFVTDRDRVSAEHARVLRLAVPLLP